MEFTEATDRLTEKVTHETLAKAMGVSLQAVRQARLNPTARSYRSPPNGWEPVVARLARERAAELVSLADALAKEDHRG